VVQTTASKRPVVRTAAIGGKPAVFFDGGDDFLDLDVNIDAAVAPEVTVISVIQNQPGTTSTFAGVWGQDNGGYDRFLISGGVAWGTGVSNGNTFVPVAGLTAEGTRLVVTTTLRVDVTNGSTVYVNGALAATFTSTTRPGTSHMSLGNINGPGSTTGQGFDGYVAELLVYRRALSTAERSGVSRVRRRDQRGRHHRH